VGANAASKDAGRRLREERGLSPGSSLPFDPLPAAGPSPADDRPHEECGVFAVYAPGEDVARLTYFGLFALQHRGQESAGIAVSDGHRLRCHKEMGLVTQVFDEGVLLNLSGHLAIGHTRYSTTGSSVLCNAQPILVDTAHGQLAVAHNGNIVNTRALRRELEAEGIRFESTNDSEVIARCIGSLHKGSIADAVKETMRRVRGAYSVVVLTRDEIVAFRDPNGVRPLCLGKLNSHGWIVASETCALNPLGAQFVREIEPGEVVVLDREGCTDLEGQPAERTSLCVFEFIYFARPDSYLFGESMHVVRQRLGRELATEHPVAADVVIPVPDASVPAAFGYHEASGIPLSEGLIRNRYIGRTFIQPDQRQREMGVRMKFTPLRENLEGRKVVMVDDSIVRGTTTGQIVRLLKDAGAAEVHVRISSPPVKWPCFYGIDMADRRQLIGAHLSVDEIRRHIGADSLGYLSLDGLLRATRSRTTAGTDHFCHACFSGAYPIPVPKEMQASKFVLEGEAGENAQRSADSRQRSAVSDQRLPILLQT
jgi:amidophosphoribosyltransferase